jgi:hypothetical protein
MWEVESVTSRFHPLVDARRLGHQFTVRISMRHKPTVPGAPLAQSPTLVWQEKITYKDFDTLEYWNWEGDLYALRPGALTFKAWRQRYIEAYNTAAMRPTDRDYLHGAVELEDRAGHPIRIGPSPGKALPTTDADKAVYIQRLIQSMECVLHVEIDDNPSLAVNEPQNTLDRLGRKRERLLLFECGADSGTERNRIKASQHLILNQLLPGSNTSRFNQGWIPPQISTNGFTWILCPSPIYRFDFTETSDPWRGLYA